MPPTSESLVPRLINSRMLPTVALALAIVAGVWLGLDWWRQLSPPPQVAIATPAPIPAWGVTAGTLADARLFGGDAAAAAPTVASDIRLKGVFAGMADLGSAAIVHMNGRDLHAAVGGELLPESSWFPSSPDRSPSNATGRCSKLRWMSRNARRQSLRLRRSLSRSRRRRQQPQGRLRRARQPAAWPSSVHVAAKPTRQSETSPPTRLRPRRRRRRHPRQSDPRPRPTQAVPPPLGPHQRRPRGRASPRPNCSPRTRLRASDCNRAT